MNPLLRNAARPLRELIQGVPLSVRVALVVAPAIVLGQVATIRLMNELRPVVGFFSPQPPPGLWRDGPVFEQRTPGEPPPLPFETFHRLSPEEAERLGLPPRPTRDAVIAFRAEGARRPPWRMLAPIFLTTAILVWLAALWITRPLARLAAAADGLGRDVGRESMPLAGPPEVRRAAQAFNRMQDRLRRFVSGRSDALLAMSHDLRTPITRLKLRLELLPDEHRAGLADDVNLLQARVDQALAFMRGVHRGEALSEIDPTALVATIVERLQDTGADASFDGRAAPILCRPTQIERAIGNLVENAVQHGGSASVSLSDKREQLCIAIRDRGPGVPPDALARLTEPFYRVESSRSRETGGSGLGLAIAKDIIESHGGTLRLANREGGGFEARVELPRSG